MEGVLVRLQPVGFHDRTVTASSACTRSTDVHAKARRGGHVKATGTSEVGPHRAPAGEQPAGTAGRIRRSGQSVVKTECPLGTHRIGATLTGAEANGSRSPRVEA